MNIKPPMWAWSPSQVSPEWRRLANEAIITPLWDVVQNQQAPPVDKISVLGHNQADHDSNSGGNQMTFLLDSHGLFVSGTSTADGFIAPPSALAKINSSDSITLVAYCDAAEVDNYDGIMGSAPGQGAWRQLRWDNAYNPTARFDIDGVNYSLSTTGVNLLNNPALAYVRWQTSSSLQVGAFREGIKLGQNQTSILTGSLDGPITKYPLVGGAVGLSGTAGKIYITYYVPYVMTDIELAALSVDPFGPIRQANRLFLPDLPRSFGSVVVPSDTQRQPITVESSGQTDINISQDSSKPALKITP